MGREGIGACTIVSQTRQLSLGRMCWITLKLEGMYSSTSRSSWPIRLNTLPPQPGQVQAGSWVTISRGRWSGSLVQTGLLARAPPVGMLRSILFSGTGGIGGGSARIFLSGLLLEFTDQQLKLFNVAVELLGGTAEPCAAQHGELHLELLDVQRLGVDTRRRGR